MQVKGVLVGPQTRLAWAAGSVSAVSIPEHRRLPVTLSYSGWALRELGGLTGPGAGSQATRDLAAIRSACRPTIYYWL